MNKFKKVNVGLIGCGTIGSGVVKLIRSGVSRKYGVKINLKTIADIKKKIKKYPDIDYTTKADKIINDPEIDIVVELIGGYEPALNYILRSFGNKKHVVSANKAVLSEFAPKIFNEAKKNNVCLGYEASVCGSIPVVNILLESIPTNIKYIIGIVNGSTNYILTKMKEKDYSKALKEAQDKGFAEKDPSFDVNGLDSAQKLSILSLISAGKYIKPSQIYIEGITNITKEDLEYANELGYTIKLLAIARLSKIPELRVHPTFVPGTHVLSSVEYENNAVYVIGEAIDAQMYTGKGAGMMPTANAVLSDIINIAREKNYNIPEFEYKSVKVKDYKDFILKYYLKFLVVDKPGVLAKICNILGAYNISISSVIQKGKGKYVPVVMMTHKSKEGDIYRAIKKIDNLDCIKSKTRFIRVFNM